MNEATKTAVQALRNMAKADPEYIKQVLTSRLKSGIGSKTNFSSIHLLWYALMNANWTEYFHQALAEGSVAFRSNIPGVMGVAKIQPWDRLILNDPKETGFVSAQFIRNPSEEEEVDFSILICGYEESEPGKQELRAFTFHPGDPIPPSITPARDLVGKRVIGEEAIGEEAIALGLVYGKFGSSADLV